jgi:SprT protein
MMQVSADIRARVDAKIAECVAKINTHYDVTMPKMTVAYDINSVHLGGEAHPSKMHLRFNPVYLNAHTDHYIAQTVPHEVAHLGVHFVEGRSYHQVRTRSGRVRLKRDIHGGAWQMMMSVLGVPADRCHAYTTPEGVTAGKPKTKYNYTCSVCQAVVVVGPKHHAKLQAGARMWHRGCSSGRLVFATTAGKVSYAQARAQGTSPTSVPVPTTPTKATPSAPKKTGTKLEQCFKWYQYYVAGGYTGSLRQMCIAVFIQEVGCTPAGASTYYSQCVKMYASA